MNKRCEWCNREIKEDESSFSVKEAESCHMCPECLMHILPKTLFPEQPFDSTEEEGDDERRNLERLPVLARVYLSKTDQISEVMPILLLDVSDGGMRFQVKKQLGQDETVILGFLSSYLVYKAVGSVRHVKEVAGRNQVMYEAGIQLTGIHQDLRF